MSDKSWFFEKIGALAKVIKGVTFWGICIGSWRGRSAAGSADSEGYLELPVFIAGDIDGSVPSARSISVVGALRCWRGSAPIYGCGNAKCFSSEQARSLDVWLG